MFTPYRRRFIFEQWPRDPNGPFLKPPPPRGKRSPNDILWGADLDSFFWTQRQAGLGVVTVWSRSMIQAFGENYHKLEEIDEEEPDPCVIHPYSQLRTLIKMPEFLAKIMDAEDHTDTNAMDIDTDGASASASAAASNENELQCSIEDLPRLQEFIPREHFPDILMVHDPDELTQGEEVEPNSDCKEDEKSHTAPIKYKRVWPTCDDPTGGEALNMRSGDEARTAHLYLSANSRIGVGHHSFVYRAALTLPHPLVAESSTGQVTVAAKLAMPRLSAREMLRNEADIYNKFPKHLMEDWSGYNLIKPVRYPVPVDAVVPKFFGYYIPESSESSASSPESGPSPILLLEECGTPIEARWLSLDEKTQCYTHILRLHMEDFVQNSIYVRNILMQPGPLYLPPSERTLARPVFRVIDFGRGERLNDWAKDRYGQDMSAYESDSDAFRNNILPWILKLREQEREARQELGINEVEDI
ncbi:uncharacterized protein FIBRA_08911 [Fibroporia radiculosa]|uniref:Protein kinase domain-containing protein n=1 Tax=Fibroporia radiculosa TaxID=599839 RepID=J4ICL7_9APHY|nr:uncharacterized protein FIBRA_08911 [Fibroporia radiculosa]CCM06631.1 predicted protein [Fibroporia radiculosa]